MSKLYVVATPIGNLGDISERAISALCEADIIAAEDTRTSGVLLAHIGAKAKLVSNHKYNEKERAGELAAEISAKDLTAAVITDAGTPCISDPGFELVKQARERGVEIIGIPGACAATVALSVSGFKANRWTFIGFLSKKKSEFCAELDKIVESNEQYFVIYETPVRILDTVAELGRRFLNAEIFVGNDLTKKFERHYTGKINDVYSELERNEKRGKGEYVIVLSRNDEAFRKTTAELPYEALIFCEILKGGSVKDAVAKLSQDYPKNELYKAGLKVKALLSGKE